MAIRIGHVAGIHLRCQEPLGGGVADLARFLGLLGAMPASRDAPIAVGRRSNSRSFAATGVTRVTLELVDDNDAFVNLCSDTPLRAGARFARQGRRST